MDFPTLTAKPVGPGWEEGLAQDNTLLDSADGGYVASRPLFSRMPGKWNVPYARVEEADKVTVRNFEKQVKGGAGMFNWTHPDGTVYTVRIKGIISFKRSDVNVNLWNFVIPMEEV